MRKLLPAIITLALSAAAGAENVGQLPDFGSSASGLLTPQQARALGRGELRELRGQNLILDDPICNDFLENLGYRLVAFSEKPDQDFTFFIVSDPDINAFAAPGGYIGVNAGLITTAQTESEVAAVLGHEIAHVTQHHLERNYEALSKVALPIQLAMLGALLASRGQGSGDVAQAAVVGGTALIQQEAINFTRDNEYEADRLGIHTMARAGYEPDAMADFFGRMGRVFRVNGESPPAFLMNHPVTTIRIAEAKARAATMKKEVAEGAATPIHLALGPDPATLTHMAAPSPGKAAARSEISFLLFRERVRVLSAHDPRVLLDHYANAPDTPSNRYGHALALGRSEDPEAELELLAGLVEASPGDLTLQLALAESEGFVGEHEAARKRLERLAAERPGNRLVTQAQAEQLSSGGNRAGAHKAADLLRPLVADRYEDVSLQLAFARANELAGDEVRAGEAHAEVALLNGRISDALYQLQSLIKRPDVDYYQRARIEARIAEVTPYALEQRKKLAPEQRLGFGFSRGDRPGRPAAAAATAHD